MERGATGSAEMTVAASDTAVAMGSGDVEVVATHRLVALAERATAAMVAPPEGRTSVATRVEIDHLRPARVGARVSATARLDYVDDRDHHFVVEVVSGDTVLARVLVTRVLADRRRFRG